jgi:Na+/H+ antiporter NhaD/arsenite permease-like protein
MLLTLAFAVTIGSVMSPIGNSQNVLVAINGNISNPFLTFLGSLLLPTLLNIFLAFFLLRFFYRKDLQACIIDFFEEPIKDYKLAFLSKVSLLLLGGLVFAKIAIVLLNVQVDFRLTYIALAPAMLILVFSRRRVEVIEKIDWRTLVFFVAMFVLMESVWESGFFQSIMVGLNLNITSVLSILMDFSQSALL